MKFKLDKKFTTERWDSLEMDDNSDDLSNCFLFGNLVLVETENRKPRTCYLKKDLEYGISEKEHNLFVGNFGADYTDTYGKKYDTSLNVDDTYWLRAGKHTKLK